jgi:hypothetical protein
MAATRREAASSFSVRTSGRSAPGRTWISSPSMIRGVSATPGSGVRRAYKTWRARKNPGPLRIILKLTDLLSLVPD